MSLVVKSAIKEVAQKAGVRVAAEFPDALDKAVEAMLSKAVARVKGNNRKTLIPVDL